MIFVDIILICYNQEQYIRQTMQSIYAQELPKDVSARIIVADDCSIDGTLETIKRMVHESPIPIVFLSEESNMGISKNYHRAFTATTADYVAILEGDDYWLPEHLSQHVEFLESHPECSMSMNVITFLQEHTGEINVGKYMFNENAYVMVDVHRQISCGNQLGNLSACVFRGAYLRELPKGLFDMPIADWMIGIMMAQRGYLGILNGSTSVYRVKASGEWAGRSRWKQHLIMMRDADMYDKFLQGKYHADWKQFKSQRWRDVHRNWMHYMPMWLQKIWHRIKGKR